MNKNYKEDFILDIQLLNGDGSPVAVPDVDFEVRFAANASSYRCGRKEGEYYNCSVLEDGRLRVVFDNHGLLPCCSLVGYATWHIPDSLMPDGIRDMPQEIDTGISLTVGPSDIPSAAEVEAMLPFIKGEPGPPTEITPEQIAEIKESVVADITPKLNDKVDKEDGKGLSTVTGEPTEYVIADIDPTLVTNALRKTPQLLTDEEKAQVKKNIGVSKLELFDDLWLSTGIVEGKQYSSVDHTQELPYELNGVRMAYEDAVYTYNRTATENYEDAVVSMYFNDKKLITNFPTGYMRVWNKAATNMFGTCMNLEVVAFHPFGIAPSRTDGMFQNCTKLREIGIINMTYADARYAATMFANCHAIEEVRLSCLKISISLAQSPLLSLESLEYLVNQATNTTSITVTVHPDVFAKLTDESNAEWNAVTVAAIAKNINFATV